MDDSTTKPQKKKKNLQTESKSKSTNPKTKKKSPNVWFSLKKSLHCKSELSEVHDPKSTQKLSSISTKKISGTRCGGSLSGCSRSIANLKDVIHGSKRNFEKPLISSPRSIGSNEFLNPITHEVILSNSTCELKITGVGDMASPAGESVARSTTFVGMLRPGTPMHHLNHSASYRSQVRKEGLGLHTNRRVSLEVNRDSAINGGNSAVSCHKCGEQFNKIEDAEAHHLSKHAGKTIQISNFYLRNYANLRKIKKFPH